MADQPRAVLHAVADAIHEWQYGDNGTSETRGEAERWAQVAIETLVMLPTEQVMEALGMVPALKSPPLDCHDECMDGPCVCSGKWIVRAWGEPSKPIRPVAEKVRPA